MSLASRLFRRELRTGELRLLVLVSVLAVAAVTAVGFLGDRVRLALEREARRLLGADLLLVADHPWSPAPAAEAARRGLELAETRVFPSMVRAAGATQLVEIKAVSPAYPLRGRLGLGDGRSGVPPPAPGSVWVDERLAGALGIGPGDTVEVGEVRLRVAAILAQEPDRGANFFAFAPRLLMSLADLPASGLEQPGARITYRLLVAGEDAAVAAFRTWATPRLERGEKIEDSENARPEIRNTLDRARRFLGLAAMATVILAAAAVALAGRRYGERHLDSSAVLRCLGATQATLLRLTLGQFALLMLLATTLGSALGYGIQFALHALVASLLGDGLPLPSLLPAFQGAAVAAVLLLGFGLPPLLRLRKVPTLRVLRRDLDPPQASWLAAWGLGLAALTALVVWIAGDLRLGLLAAGGFAAAAALFAGAARLGIALLGRWPAGSRYGWRQGAAGLRRRAGPVTLQVVALALGAMALLVVSATRSQLLEAWQRATPADAPNRFIVNIQPEQRDALAARLREGGIAAELAPMVRGRLATLSGRPVAAADYPDDDRAQRLVEREFNLSWRDALPPGNEVTAGRWFAAEDKGKRVASVEEGLARTLGIKVGDRLEFRIAGQSIDLEVVGLRRLDWNSMRVNFFVLTPPGVLEDQPASYITSFHLPSQQLALGRDLVARFPNLTLIDLGVLIGQFRDVIGQVASAVELIFSLTLGAGLAVLYAALVAGFAERRREFAVLRALGARRRQLAAALLAELAATGALAGLCAAAGAALLGQVVAHRVFDMNLETPLLTFPLTALATGLLAAAVGWGTLGRLLAVPPLETLRG